MKIFKAAAVYCAATCLLAQSCLAAVPIEAYRSYIRGLLAARSGNAAQAAAEYKRTAELDENAAFVYRDLAFSLWQSGKTEEAVAAAKKLSEFYGDDLSTLLFLGSFYLLVSEPYLARAAWEKVLKLDPGNETAILYLAAFHSSDNNPEKAVSYWNEYLKKEPGSSQAYYQLGLAEEKLKNDKKAMDYYTKSLSLTPEIPEAYLSLAQLYEKSENFKAAGQSFEKYLELAPDNLTVLLYLGGLYYRQKDFDAAQNAFERAFKLNPADNTVCFWLGVIAENKKDWDSAIKYFEIISRTDNNTAVMIRLSYYYAAKMDHVSALKYLKKVVEMDPSNPVSYYLLGLGYSDLKKYSKAEQSFKKAKNLNPEMEGISFHLGMLYDQTGKPDAAMQAMRAELKVNPDFAPALNYVGYTWAEKGENLDEAEKMIKKALEIEPNNGTFIDSLGWLYFKKGDYAAAEGMLLKATALYPDSLIFEHQGDNFVKLGKTSDAWTSYRKALDLDPSNKNARRKLSEIEKSMAPGEAAGNYLRKAVAGLEAINTLKAAFSLSGESEGTNFRFAGIFQYEKPGSWRADILGSFLAPQISIIQDRSLSVYPEALADALPASQTGLFDIVRAYFSAEALADFGSNKASREFKRGKYFYTAGEKRLVIDAKTGAVKELKPSAGKTIRFNRYGNFDGFSVPDDIDLFSGPDKISARLKFSGCSVNKAVEAGAFAPPAKTPVKQ